MEGEHGVGRRTVLMSAGIGIGAGLVSGIAPAQAEGARAAPKSGARNTGRTRATSSSTCGASAWARRRPGEKPLPVLFLVHGSSNSTRSSYDLDVPGKGEYSLMNVLAREGYDVWTMDHDGYGYSGSSGNNSDIASGVEDLKAAMPVIAKETGQQKMHMYGTSSGAIRAGAYRAGAAGARRPAGAVGLHLQGQRLGRDRRGAEQAPTSCVPTPAASATPP